MNDKKLNNLLLSVFKDVPFYQQFANKNISNLQELPLISKQDICRDLELFLNKSIISLNQFKELEEKSKSSFGETTAMIGSNLIYYEQTSGTTGIPFGVIKTINERVRQAGPLWKNRRAHLPKLKPEEVFYSIHLHGIANNRNIVQNKRKYSPDQLCEILSETKIKMWHTNIRFIRTYLKYCEYNNIYPCKNLDAIELSGIYVNLGDKQEFEKIFECKILDYYATIEVWLIGYTCPLHHFHIDENNIILELIDDENNVIIKSGQIGKIVVTSKNLFSMPFIRYITGDYGMYEQDPCDCGNPQKRIRIIEGRETDRIDGFENKYGNVVFRDVIRNVSYNNKLQYGFSQVCVVQENRNSFEVRVYCFKGNKSEFERNLEETTKRYLSNKVSTKFKYFDKECAKEKPAVFSKKLRV